MRVSSSKLSWRSREKWWTQSCRGIEKFERAANNRSVSSICRFATFAKSCFASVLRTLFFAHLNSRSCPRFTSSIQVIRWNCLPFAFNCCYSQVILFESTPCVLHDFTFLPTLALLPTAVERRWVRISKFETKLLLKTASLGGFFLLYSFFYSFTFI